MLIRVIQARQQAVYIINKLDGGVKVVTSVVRTYFVDLLC